MMTPLDLHPIQDGFPEPGSHRSAVVLAASLIGATVGTLRDGSVSIIIMVTWWQRPVLAASAIQANVEPLGHAMILIIRNVM